MTLSVKYIITSLYDLNDYKPYVDWKPFEYYIDGVEVTKEEFNKEYMKYYGE